MSNLPAKNKLAMNKPVKVTDESLMEFGVHKNTKVGNLPDHYCRWLIMQDWMQDGRPEHVELYKYLLDNEDLFAEKE